MRIRRTSIIPSACAVDAWRHAYDYSVRNWGGGLSFSSLLDDAIRQAEDGFPVTTSQSFWLDFRKSEVADWTGFREVFMPG
ncbi:gamma-glutamyltransferase, partial [Rhizobium leguminosarum]|uniref:gamma-glutamyltransferase n=1 Tax=Rhizobium leguminosarum TaxID=384 RepID=UPI003F95964D